MNLLAKRLAAVLLRLCLLPLLLGGTSALAEAPLFLEVRLEPEQGVVGEKRVLLVDLYTRTWFTRAPEFPHLAIEDAVTLPPSSFGTNFSERRGGESYAVQRREYVIYPQRAGDFVIPPISVAVSVAGEENGEDGGSPAATRKLTSEALVFPVTRPPMAEAYVATTELQLSDRFSQPLTTVRAGDGLVRTVRIGVEGVLGMLVPPLAWPEVPGVRQYRDPADIDDQVNRGDYRGERVETVTYLFEVEGEVVLPAIRVHWWNTETASSKVAELPAVTVRVQPALVLQTPGADEAARLSDSGDQYLYPVYLYLFMGLIAIIGLTLWWWRVIGKRLYQSWNTRRKSSEAALFNRVKHACRKGSAEQVLRSAYCWLDAREHRGNQLRGLWGAGDKRYQEAQETVELVETIEPIVAAVYGSDNLLSEQNRPSQDSYHRFLAAIRGVRRIRDRKCPTVGSLQPLNPSSTLRAPEHD